jgi:hypothetical protein
MGNGPLLEIRSSHAGIVPLTISAQNLSLVDPVLDMQSPAVRLTRILKLADRQP